MVLKIILLSILSMVILPVPRIIAVDETAKEVLPVDIEETWIFFVDEPSGYLQDARESFVYGDSKEAAQRIRKAAAFIKLESHRTKNRDKAALMSSAKELMEMAKTVEKGSIATGVKLEDAFSRAEYALADHYHYLALEYVENEQVENAAISIEAAVSHLLFASFWAEERLEESDITAAKEARDSVKEMSTQGIFNKKRMREAIKGIGRGIQKLGNKIKPIAPKDSRPVSTKMN